MADVKEFKITGAALKPMSGGRRRATRKRQDGGDNSGALMQLAGQSVSQTIDPNAQKLMQEAASSVAKVLPALPLTASKQTGGMSTGAIVNLSSSRSATLPGSPEPSPTTSGVSPSQPGAVGGSRVVLVPHKRKTRIALKGKKYGGSTSMEGMRPLFFKGGATKKASKIHLRVKGITSRLNKAKKAKKMAMNAPISQIKSRLEKAGVIKSGSKAPESMLRNMYADLLITKKGL